MNLNKLFPIQKELDDHIIREHNLQGQDLLKKKTVALLTELYECVNEARFFKFWSKNQKPNRGKKIDVECGFCEGAGRDFMDGTECPDCEGSGLSGEQRQTEDYLLEEYVDTIHFILSIGNDLGYTEHKYIEPDYHDLNDLTIGITNLATLIPEAQYQRHISTLFNFIIKLGYSLGFDEKTVIQAYMDKNKVNHIRQVNGY